MHSPEPIIDVTRKFVRLIEERPDGLVAFEFAIGEPELCVEMLLPRAAYEAFCRSNQVVRLEGARAGTDSGADWDWSLHQATQQRFRQQ